MSDEFPMDEPSDEFPMDERSLASPTKRRVDPPPLHQENPSTLVDGHSDTQIMNRRDPPSTGMGGASRKSLIRDRVRKRRAAVGIGAASSANHLRTNIDRNDIANHPHDTVIANLSRQHVSFQKKQSVTTRNQRQRDPEGTTPDEIIHTSPSKQKHNGNDVESTSNSTPSTCKLTNIECTLDSSPRKGSPFPVSPIETPKNRMWNNPSDVSPPKHRLYNGASLQGDYPLERTSPSKTHRAFPYHLNTTDEGQSLAGPSNFPTKKNSPSKSATPKTSNISQNNVTKFGSAAELGLTEYADENLNTGVEFCVCDHDVESLQREFSKPPSSEDPPSKSSVLNAVKVIPSSQARIHKWNARAKAKHARIQKMRSTQLLRATAATEDDECIARVLEEKCDIRDDVPSPPRMDDLLHTASPKQAEEAFIKSRLQYMMDWNKSKDKGSDEDGIHLVTPKKDDRVPVVTSQNYDGLPVVHVATPKNDRADAASSQNDRATATVPSQNNDRTVRISTAPPSAKAPSFDEANQIAYPQRTRIRTLQKIRKQSRLEQTIAVLSLDKTSESVFGEDDSLFDNPFLKADREKRMNGNNQESRRNSGEPKTNIVMAPKANVVTARRVNLVSPIKETMDLSVGCDSDRVRDVHLSFSSRNVNRCSKVSAVDELNQTASQAVVSPVKGTVVSPPRDAVASPVRGSDPPVRDMTQDIKGADPPDHTQDLSRTAVQLPLPENPRRRFVKSLIHLSQPNIIQADSKISESQSRKSMKSFTAPSFDEAASVRSRLSCNNEVEKNETSLDISVEADHILNSDEVNSSALDISREADSVLEGKANTTSEVQHSLNTSREADAALDEEEETEPPQVQPSLSNVEIGISSMVKLLENAAQEATWSKPLLKSASPASSPNRMLPPIHPTRSLHHHARDKNAAAPTITEFSPTRSDHSADAAAGAKQKKLKDLIFGPLNDNSDCNDEELKQIESFPSKRDRRDQDGSMSLDSWEVDIIGSSRESPVISSNTSCSTLKLDKHLESKLEMLRQNSELSDAQVSHADDKSFSDSVFSEHSIQPSVESACVRQNVNIAMLMEDTMMDFMVTNDEEGEEASVHSVPDADDVDDPPLQLSPSLDSGLLSESYTVDSDPQPCIQPQLAQQFQYVPSPAPTPKPIISKASSRHNYLSKKHCLSLLSVDEEEEFNSGKDFKPSPLLLNDSSSKSARSKVSSPVKAVPPHKNLGKFLDKFRDNLMTGCAPIKDEDLASSLIDNTSQYNNSILAGIEDDVVDEHSDRLTPLPFSKGMTPQERALKRREDATPLRTNTTKSRVVSAVRSFQPPDDMDTLPTGREFGNADTEIGVQSKADHLQTMSHEDSLQTFDRYEKLTEQLEEESLIHDPTDVVGVEVVRNESPFENDQEFFAEKETHQIMQAVTRSSRERHKSRSLHWNSNNGVNEDEQYSPPKFVPVRSRARISRKVLSYRTSLSSISVHQASIRQHFQDDSDTGSLLYGTGHDNKHDLSQINECSVEDDSSDEADDHNATAAYDYDDYVKDFSSIDASAIAADAKVALNSIISGDASSPQHSQFRGKESSSTLNEMSSNLPGNRRRSQINQLSPSKSNMSTSDSLFDLTTPPSQLSTTKSIVSTSESLLDQYHPHDVPVMTKEVSRSRLEEKLRELGLSSSSKRDCSSSVATSELGSLMSKSELGTLMSKESTIPLTIFHRTHPPNRSSDSARSSPSSHVSSMGNTYSNSDVIQDSLKIKLSLESPVRSNLHPRPGPSADLNEDVIRSRQFRRENSAATAAATINQHRPTVDPNQDVVNSQRLLRNNVAAAASSVSRIQNQLSMLRSTKTADVTETTPSPTINRSMNQTDHRSNDEQASSKPKLFSGGTQENFVIEQLPTIASLRARYQDFISSATASQQTSRKHAEYCNPKDRLSKVDQITSFWKQLEFNGDDSVPSVDKSRPNLHKKPFVADARKICDDASQESNKFEVAPRGNGYGVLNKNQWVKDMASDVEDPNVHVVAKLPNRNIPRPPQNTGTASYVKGQSPTQHHLSSSKYSSNSFFNKSSPSPSGSNRESSSPSKSTMKAQNNAFSNGWKNSTRKPPPAMNRSISTDKLHFRSKSIRRKNDNSWIAAR